MRHPRFYILRHCICLSVRLQIQFLIRPVIAGPFLIRPFVIDEDAFDDLIKSDDGCSSYEEACTDYNQRDLAGGGQPMTAG